MKDVKGIEIKKGNILKDLDNHKYEVIEKSDGLYAKSLFCDAGCGEYSLYLGRIIVNEFTIVK
jgi:hypothetical protein